MTYKRRRAAPDWDDDTAHQDDAKPARSDLGRAVAAWARAVKRAPLPDGAKVVAWCLSDYARMADSLEMYKTSGQASCWPRRRAHRRRMRHGRAQRAAIAASSPGRWIPWTSTGPAAVPAKRTSTS